MTKYVCIACTDFIKVRQLTVEVMLRARRWLPLPEFMGKHKNDHPALCPKCAFMVVAAVAKGFDPGKGDK